MAGPVQPPAAHARVSPSSLHRIRLCAASLTMQEAFPHLPWEDEERSAEGTCAHWVLALILTSGRVVEVGVLDPAGTPVTQEIIDGAETAAEAVDDILAAHGKTRADLIVEQRVAIPRIHADCWGTPDIRFWGATGVCVMIDFKFGYRYVDEFENEQLVAYTIGAIDERQRGHDLGVTCQNWIIQPRAYGRAVSRCWEYQASAVRGFVNTVANAVAVALAPDPPARVTPEGCRDCRARHACPTYQLAGQDAMAYTGQPVPLELSPAALSTELAFAQRQLKLLKARVVALEAQGLYLVRNGASLPHHKAEATRSFLTWNVPDSQVIAIGAAMGVKLAKPADAVTPLQAVKAGLHDSLLATMASRKPGALVLVEDDGSKARRVFGAGS